MHETNLTSGLTNPQTRPARELTNDYLTSYAIEDESQVNAYARLAELVREIDERDGIVLSLTPGFEWDGGDESYYSILVVAGF